MRTTIATRAAAITAALLVGALCTSCDSTEEAWRQKIGATPKADVDEARADAEALRDSTSAADLEAAISRLEAIISDDEAAIETAVEPIRDVGDSVNTFVPGASVVGNTTAATTEWAATAILGLTTLAGLVEALRRRKLQLEAQRKRNLLARIVKANEEYGLVRGGDEESEKLRTAAARWAGSDAVAEMKRAKGEEILPATAA